MLTKISPRNLYSVQISNEAQSSVLTWQRSHGMTHLKGDFTLDDDDLSAFLSEFDQDWAFEISPIGPMASVTSISPMKCPPKPRRYPRLNILSARKTVAELELQLQILKEKRAFCESLKTATPASAGACLRLVSEF